MGAYLFGCGSYEQAREKKQHLIDQFGFEESLIHLHPSDVTSRLDLISIGAYVIVNTVLKCLVLGSELLSISNLVCRIK